MMLGAPTRAVVADDHLLVVLRHTRWPLTGLQRSRSVHTHTRVLWHVRADAGERTQPRSVTDGVRVGITMRRCHARHLRAYRSKSPVIRSSSLRV